MFLHHFFLGEMFSPPGDPELDLDSRELLLDVASPPFCSRGALILAGLLLTAGVLVHSIDGQWARPKELRELVSLVTKSYQQQSLGPRYNLQLCC